MKKILLIPFLLIGCKTQKSSIEYKDVIKVDTFIRNQIKTIYEPINDTIYIPIPCDSTEKFYASVTIPNGRAILTKKNNNLAFIVSTNKNIQNSELKTQKSFANSIKIKEKIVIKYRTPSWMIATILIESIIIFLYLYFRFVIH